MKGSYKKQTVIKVLGFKLFEIQTDYVDYSTEDESEYLRDQMFLYEWERWNDEREN